MPRRIEIELTSSRDDGSWTWRAAGAKEPRGTLPATLLPGESKVGDVLRVDAEFFVDGIEITGVLPPKGTRQEPERLELLVPVKEEPLVTTTLTTRTKDDRGPRREGGRREGARREGDGARRGAPRTDRKDRSERDDRPERKDRPPRRTRPEPPPVPVVERPKAKRLRPGKVHRTALLEALPEEQRPIAEQVVLGGLPAVRQAIEKQNAERTAAGEAPIAAGPLMEMAEKLVPKVRAAEWRDRAEAAQRDLEVLDLRDLRSVVSTADAAAKDDETRALAQQLREGLSTRAEAEQKAWLAELTATVEVGRIVRALRLSSRPPKAGSPLPAELATKLIEGAGAALTEDAAPERWVAVLDALAFAPVRDKVIPASLPKDLHPDVRATIARLATRIPKIAHIFEIEPDRNAPRPKIERRRPPKKQPPKAKSDKPKRDKPPRDAKPTQPEATTTEPQAPTAPDEPTPTPATSEESSAPESSPPAAPVTDEPEAAEQKPEPVATEEPSAPGGEPSRPAEPSPEPRRTQRSRARRQRRSPAKPLGVRGSPPQNRRRAAPPTRRRHRASRRRAPLSPPRKLRFRVRNPQREPKASTES